MTRPADTTGTPDDVAPLGRVDTDPAAAVNILFAMAVTGADAKDDLSDAHLSACTVVLSDVMRRMDTDVTSVVRDRAYIPADPINGSWSIAWENGDRTVVSILSDGPSVVMGSDGQDHHDGSAEDIRLVTSRHVRDGKDGTVASLAVAIDVSRLRMPEDDGGARRAVHIARSVTTIVAGSIGIAAFRRTHAAQAPRTGTDGTVPLEQVAMLAGLAAVLDAGRDDVLGLPARDPETKVTLRPSTPLASARCDVGTDGATASLEGAEDRLPSAPISLSASIDPDATRGVGYVIANIAPPRIDATIGGHDPIDQLRLARLAAPYRSTPDAAS